MAGLPPGIDTGVHAKGWSRKQAQDYLADNTALSIHEITTEIDRYISWPGQANSYMLGMLEFMRLRELAKTELGEAFDLRDFHDRVLENGSLTLPMLDDSLNAWIKVQK